MCFLSPRCSVNCWIKCCWWKAFMGWVQLLASSPLPRSGLFHSFHVVFAHVDHPPEASFTTTSMTKHMSSSMSIETRGHSPPGRTPSQQRGTIHCIDEVMDIVPEIDYGVINEELDRLLSVTRVMNIYEEPFCVLQYLCGAFQIMSKAHSHHHTAHLPRKYSRHKDGAIAQVVYDLYDAVDYVEVHHRDWIEKVMQSTFVVLQLYCRG